MLSEWCELRGSGKLHRRGASLEPPCGRRRRDSASRAKTSSWPAERESELLSLKSSSRSHSTPTKSFHAFALTCNNRTYKRNIMHLSKYTSDQPVPVSLVNHTDDGMAGMALLYLGNR